MWTLPALVLIVATVLALPTGLYMAWVYEGRYKLPRPLQWIERRLDTGPQNWKQYCLAFMLINVFGFIVGFAVLALQPWLPLNPDHKGMLAPSTIFNTVASFLTNTNLQHYSGEVHLSYFSQLFCICWKQVLSPALGLCALVAVIRGLRGDSKLGNAYVDLWRGVAYIFLPICFVLGIVLISQGTPMTLRGNAQVTTLEPGAMGTDPATGAPMLQQPIARGPVAAIVAVKQLGTNGGGFFGTNSCHPFKNPTAWTNFLTCVSIIFLPIACLVMFGRMIRNFRHAGVIYGVMLLLSLATIGWVIRYDTEEPNPALTAHDARSYPDVNLPAVAGLPVDQSLGNLEGKELRFGTAAGAIWAALTTNTSNGSTNCSHDCLNPLAGLTPLVGMWLNCIWGGVGVGLINLLVYLVVGVFLAGLMVGRTPEYLGRKIEAREMKLASLALLIHPLMILAPVGLFAVTDWGLQSRNNPAAHGFDEILYEFTSASANNGSDLPGLANVNGFADPKQNPSPPAPFAVEWDIATGLVMLISRFVPIIAPIALAGSLSVKRLTPFTVGTLRTDTITFGFVLLGTILLVGALLFLPAAVLAPIAEHLGPLPFGG